MIPRFGTRRPARRLNLFFRRAAISLALGAISVTAAEPTSAKGSPYARWSRGPSSDAGFFPLAVWLQSPSNAERYRNAGFNTYVALWRGPTDEQLAALKTAGMKVICRQPRVRCPRRGAGTGAPRDFVANQKSAWCPRGSRDVSRCG